MEKKIGRMGGLKKRGRKNYQNMSENYSKK